MSSSSLCICIEIDIWLKYSRKCINHEVFPFSQLAEVHAWKWRSLQFDYVHQFMAVATINGHVIWQQIARSVAFNNGTMIHMHLALL